MPADRRESLWTAALLSAARFLEVSGLLEQLMKSGEAVYGVTTGFGASCETTVPAALAAEMAANLVRFHGCGTGRISRRHRSRRAVMVVRLASLRQGRSGVRPIVLERLCDLINRRILPRIPAEGSVGASGDLTPLSYVAAVLIGEREVILQRAKYCARGRSVVAKLASSRSSCVQGEPGADERHQRDDRPCLPGLTSARAASAAGRPR